MEFWRVAGVVTKLTVKKKVKIKCYSLYYQNDRLKLFIKYSMKVVKGFSIKDYTIL